MKHDIPTNAQDPWRAHMAEAVQTCVHCGFCLPACPTYLELGQEMDSPRGRIVLMKEVLEGKTELAAVLPHVDRCLGCLGCETACPSGVKYRELISPFRQMAAAARPLNFLAKARRWGLLQTLPYPQRFRWALRLGVLARPLRKLLPSSLRTMLELLPPSVPKQEIIPTITPAQGPRRARVALLAGCAQQVLAPQINRATVNVLARNGVEVIIPEAQGCCGALAWHVGAGEPARAQARRNLTAFPTDVDAILTNAAGCGSGLHEYPQMLAGTPDEAAAIAFSHRVQDVSKFLAELGLVAPPAARQSVRVAYHDACHLSHAQGVRSAPRELLRSINGLELCEIPDGEICCGSAGTYNLDQPEIANALGLKKAQAIAQTGAAWLAAGNIGCLTQIAAQLRPLAPTLRVVHTLELLELAYAGEL